MQPLRQLNSTLLRFSRLQGIPQVREKSVARDIGLLLVLGVVAAFLTSTMSTPIRLPGHAIVRGTIPMVCGLSIAPLVAAGSLMSAAALASFAIAAGLGVHVPPLPAAIGLIALGPALDVATRHIPTSGYRLYLRFAAAGVAANLVAFAARVVTGPGHFPRHAMGIGSYPAALASFVTFGAVAGLVCGAVWFRTRPHSEITP